MIWNSIVMIDTSKRGLAEILFLISLIIMLIIDILQLYLSYTICKESANVKTGREIFEKFMEVFLLQQLITIAIVVTAISVLRMKSDETTIDRIVSSICLVIYFFDLYSMRLISKVFQLARLSRALLGGVFKEINYRFRDSSSRIELTDPYLNTSRSRIK